MHSGSPLSSGQRRLYRLLLKLLPESFRSRFGEDMEQLFAEQLASAAGPGAKLQLWLRAVADVAVQGTAERMHAARRQSVRQPRRWSTALASTLHDIQKAGKLLLTRPTFTLPIVLTLGLGIGLASAMALVIHGVLLRPLPYPDADRLIRISERTATANRVPTSYANFADWREEASLFVGMTAVARSSPTVSGGARPVRAPALHVTSDYFDVAGVQPILGRTFSAEENIEGGPAVVVVSEDFWRDILGSAPLLDATSVTLENLRGSTESYQVVGVMPRNFDLLGASQVYLSLDRAVPWNARANHVVTVVGRLRAGVSREAAAAQLQAINERIRAKYPEVDNRGLTAEPLADEILGPTRRPLVLLLGAAGLLLLIAFSNVACALLARGIERQREMQVRTALGASRWRLVGQLLAESLVLAAASAAIAVLIARALLSLFGAVDPSIMPRLHEVVPAWPGLILIAALLASFGVLLFGISTALLTSRWAAAGLRLRGGGQQRGQRLVWRTLLGGEVALAFTLLITAGLLGRSLYEIAVEDTGFDSSNVTTIELNLPGIRYKQNTDYVQYFDIALAALRAEPGVTAAGLNIMLPMANAGGLGGPIQLEPGSWEDVFAQYRVADEGYFAALRIPLLAGRLFDSRDRDGAPHVTIINENMARRIWGDADPIGKRFSIPGMDGFDEEWLTVVGVVADARPWDVEAGRQLMYYVHYRQRPTFLQFTGANIVVRTSGPVIPEMTLRDILASVDAHVPLRVRTLNERLGATTGDRRFVFTLLGVFAALALVLSGIGIWGVSSFVVSRRVREMGIRLVLGAAPLQVRRMLQREAFIPLMVGLGAGLLLAAAITKWINSLLFGVVASDVLTYVAAAATLGLTTWLASYLPARRTARLDPGSTLRAE